MRQIKNQNLAELLMQLHFTSQEKRQKQLDCAEKLLAIIDREKEYPFEFVCYRITGFRPRGIADEQLIKGDELVDDLGIFISRLSGQLSLKAQEQNQKVYTIGELATLLCVSTKTIDRWRKRGLAATRFVFEDGKKRLGFSQSTVDEFLKTNQNLVNKAKTFERLTKKQKQQIVKQAVTLAAQTAMSRHQIIDHIAAKINRAHETVRYTLLNYEKSHPEKNIFSKSAGVITPDAAAELYKLFKQGYSVSELMSSYNRSKSSIYRIINHRRTKALWAQKIEFIFSEEFLEKDAELKILSKPITNPAPITLKDIKPFELADGSLPKYLRTLKNIPLLNREREIELFRRYNYLKYLAREMRTEIKTTSLSSARLRRIETYLAQAETIKNMIIEANLRLVVSIANKHTITGANMLDLVSEGNFSLMRAVEKFDYTRGFRFGTYASWAIAKDYARKIPAEAARLDKATTASMTNIQRDFRNPEAAGVVAIERARQSLVQVIKDELDEREQYIISNHFGLIGSPVRKKKKTLKQIGDDLGLSKERVRQIELIALQKLKHSLSIEEFELLMG